MRISRTNAALGAIAAALLAVGIPTLGPAIGQDSPESLLPPGFGDPVDTPAPAPAATPSRASDDPIPERQTTQRSTDAPTPRPSTSPGAPPATDPNSLARYEMPPYAQRSLTRIGAAGPGEGGLQPDAFGSADGRNLQTLMRRLDAPIASRWLGIALRRALVSRVDTPRGLSGADYAAERAWLLLRMGESVAARAIVQQVDPENYTPKLFQIALQAALATGDPGALCSVADQGATLERERGWIVARAMCAGLSGQPSKGATLIAQARNRGIAGGIDLLLAQKIAGTGSRGRQAVTIEWDNVEQLTTWRYGLATASGTEIPENLFRTVGRNVQSWRAQSPALDAATRARAAEEAVVRGVFSNAAYVDLFAAVAADDDGSLAETGIARDLRAAYAGADRATRREALKQLWEEPKTADARFARLVLTAHAADRLPTDTADIDIDKLVASMLSAGLDRSAQRWRGRATAGGDAWAMLKLADPDGGASSYSEISGYAGANDAGGRKRQMFFAAMAGLGRLSGSDVSRGASGFDVNVNADNSWVRAIKLAAAARQPGTVVLLAATGMQTPLWRGVPPEVLYHVVAALRSVGLEGEARMIAAEALARL